MSNIANDDLLEKINNTVDWASDLGDTWVGTTTGRILDSQRDTLLSVVKSNDLELAKVLERQLAETCKHAEDAIQEGDMHE